MTKAIIFDMDGTIFQTDKILELSLEDTFNNLRSQNMWDAGTPIEQYRDIMGAPLPKVWETLLTNFMLEERELVDSYFLERLIENIRNGEGDLYPNVKEVFSDLTAKKHSIFIASNGLIKYLDAIVGYYNLDQWVTETFSIQLIDSLNKSDLVENIVKKYGISTGAVVGDRFSDIKAAKDNGLVSIGCNFDFSREDELEQADLIIDDLLELKEMI